MCSIEIVFSRIGCVNMVPLWNYIDKATYWTRRHERMRRRRNGAESRRRGTHV